MHRHGELSPSRGTAAAGWRLAIFFGAEWHGRGLMSERLSETLMSALRRRAENAADRGDHPSGQCTFNPTGDASRTLQCEGGPLRDYWRVGGSIISSPMVYSFIAS